MKSIWTNSHIKCWRTLGGLGYDGFDISVVFYHIVLLLILHFVTRIKLSALFPQSLL